MEKRLAVIAACVLLGACSHGGGIKAACAVFEPITYSSRDTPETVAQVERFDVKWNRLCGK